MSNNPYIQILQDAEPPPDVEEDVEFPLYQDIFIESPQDVRSLEDPRCPKDVEPPRDIVSPLEIESPEDISSPLVIEPAQDAPSAEEAERPSDAIIPLRLEVPQDAESSQDADSPLFALEKQKPGPRHAVRETFSPLERVQSHTEKPTSLIREIPFIIILCMAQIFFQSGLGMSVGPLPIIARSFGIEDNPGQMSWPVAAYGLTVGTFILIAGRLGDLFGHKLLFISGFLWYSLWSMLAGFSIYTRSPEFFDTCRALQGIGPAFLLPNALAILGRTYVGVKKDMTFALFGACAPGGFVIGAVFSSLIAQDLWWPWAFWIMAIACFVCAIVGFFAIPYAPPPEFGNDGISIWERIDLSGSILGVAGLVLFNFAWNQGPVVGWPSPYVYFILVIGSMLIAAFFYIERQARFPLVPWEALNAKTGFVLGCVGSGWGSFGIWMFYFFQFNEVLRKESALLASTHFVPVVISGLMAAMMTGFLLSKIPASAIMIVALAAFTAGLVVLVTAPVHQTYWAQTFVSLLIMPFGMDMSFPAGTILLSNTMHEEHQGLAASFVNTVVCYSISISLGIAGTIEGQVNDNGANVLKGYRGALYFGVGLAGAGAVLAFFFVLHELAEKKKAKNAANTASQEMSA